jgi:glucarate dehydratase
MRIEGARITPIALGDPPLLNAGGLHAPYALRLVLELDVEGGVTGLSEIPGDIDVLTGLEGALPELRGRSIHDQHALRRLLEQRLGPDGAVARGDSPWDRRRLVHAASAIEVACLDALGKRLGCRVVDLLGGAVRDKVPYAGYLFFKYEGAGGPLGFETDASASGWAGARQAAALDVEGMVAQARAMIARFGFASLKLKAGILPPELEVRAALALRETFGRDVPIRIDPNAVWSYETALRFGRELKGAIEYYEDPVRGQEQMGRLRRELAIPLATNMCTTSFEELPTSFTHGSEDIILADHHYWGGLRASLELARLCGTMGRDLSMHSNSHAGISFAAMTHLGAALPSLRYALDTHYPWQEDEIIVGGKLRIEGGEVAVPDGPGLGVELERDALRRAHERYLASGLLRRDDELEMQKKEPGWRFQRTRF